MGNRPLKRDAILVIETRYPLVVVEFHGTPSDQAFGEYLTRMDSLQQRPAATLRPVVIIQDTLAQRGSISASQRKQLVDWQKRNHDRIASTVLGIVFVIDSAIVRGAATAILWVYKPCYDYALVSTRTAAEEWGLRKLSGTLSTAPGGA